MVTVPQVYHHLTWSQTCTGKPGTVAASRHTKMGRIGSCKLGAAWVSHEAKSAALAGAYPR